MKGTKHFIIHIPELHTEELKTESGVKIYADKRYSRKETANTVFQVVEVPFGYDGPIKKGWWLLVDPTLIFEQSYEKGGAQENRYLLDREKRHYKVDKSLVVCFRESENDTWKGFNENVICEKIKVDREDFKKVGSLFIPETKVPKSVKGQMKIVIDNEKLNENEVYKGDTVFVKEMFVVPLKIEGVTYQWLRNKEVLAKNTAA